MNRRLKPLARKTAGAALVLLLGFGFSPAGLGAGSEAIIKQRAKDLRDQNNARQGVPPPAQPKPAPAAAQPAPAAPTTVTMTPQQQGMARLQGSLLSFKAGTPATAEQTQQLTRDLLSAAQGPAKPSTKTAGTLAQSLAAALSEKPLSRQTHSRLLQNLNVVLNPAKVGASQMQEVIADVESIFTANGIPKKDAAAIAANLKAVTAETQKPASPGK